MACQQFLDLSLQLLVCGLTLCKSLAQLSHLLSEVTIFSSRFVLRLLEKLDGNHALRAHAVLFLEALQAFVWTNELIGRSLMITLMIY